MPILSRKGQAIRFARPVQQLVPATFIDRMESQNLTAKEMVSMLEACQEIGYQAVMRKGLVRAIQIPDPVSVSSTDLSQYDSFYGKKAVQ